jgi:hypothetical protein
MLVPVLFDPSVGTGPGASTMRVLLAIPLWVGMLVMLHPRVGTAAFSPFTDRTVWETAVGPATATEDFNSHAADMLNVPAPVVLNGMIVTSAAGTDFNFAIDVPPYFSPLQGIDGTPKANGRAADFAPLSLNETWRIDFPISVTAWGADFKGAGDPPNGNLMIEVFDESNALLGTLQADASPDVEFLGFQLSTGERSGHVIFRAPGGVDGFDIDNLAMVQVPEPSTIVLALVLALSYCWFWWKGLLAKSAVS